MFRGLTQQDLAEKVHKTRPLISSIEQTGIVNVHTLNKICEVLEVKPEDLKANSNDITLAALNTKREVEALKLEVQNLRIENAHLLDLVETQRDLIHLLKSKQKK